MRFVAPLARLLGYLVDDATHVVGIVEHDIGTVFDASGALHVHDGLPEGQRRIARVDAAPVDHDLRDGIVLEQLLQRAVVEEVVDHRARQRFGFEGVEGNARLVRDLLHQTANEALDGRRARRPAP